MIELLAGCALIALAVILEIVVPGQPFYQYGWYAALMAGAFVVCAVRGAALGRRDPRVALPLALALAGTGALAIAGVANGLFAPDPSLAIGSPGASLRVDDLRGSLVFPLETTDPVVRLERGGSTTLVPPGGTHIAGAFALSQVPRRVLAVDVADARGAHLTVTQPNGTAFLSPVLTMPSEQNVAGMSLPFDTFAVPAAHRIVKAVLFDERHAAMLKAADTGGRGAALFAVDDEADRAIPHGMGLARDGGSVSLAGLRIRGVALTYPAIRIAPIPVPLVVLIGTLLLIAGAAWTLRTRSYSRT